MRRGFGYCSIAWLFTSVRCGLPLQRQKRRSRMEQESQLSVLLIEDDPDTARMVQWVLSAGGSTPMGVDWAADLNSGIERLERSDYQAILLDLNLPDSCGFDTFARVRQKAPDRAVIVLTGQEDQALAMQMLRGGADEYLFT